MKEKRKRCSHKKANTDPKQKKGDLSSVPVLLWFRLSLGTLVNVNRGSSDPPSLLEKTEPEAKAEPAAART